MRFWTLSTAAATASLLAALLFSVPAHAQEKHQSKAKLPRPRRLDRGTELRRDPATGELRDARAVPLASAAGAVPPGGAIRARVNLVEVGCNARAPDGAPLRGLGREDFRLFEDGLEQRISHLDASSEPASIALLVDVSPSVFRELDEMKAAARALSESLSPGGEVALVAFAGGAHLLLPFSRDRALLERAIASSELARVANSSESNIYRAIYFTARELFRGRSGRKAIVVLTDGQDSGQGLSWDPSSAFPQPGAAANRLTFEDVARELAAAGIQVYAVSTQNRPKAMTDAWLEAHRSAMLVTPDARELGMVHYTLYLAELVRRAGGELFFLREIGTLSEVYRRIARTLGAQYTLGYYPSAGLAQPGWRMLRVELARHSDARLTYRVAYYVPAE
jgi:Ca-activated chloride channel family protein